MSKHATAEVVTGPQVTVGLDLGDRFSQLVVIDGAGEVVEEGRIRTTPSGVDRWFGRRRAMRVVLEVGTHSPWMSRQVASYGHEVIVANPRKVRAIYENDRKDDRVDAEMLARLGRLDPKLLRPIQHRGERAQAVRTMIHSRDVLVRSRTSLINHIRGSIKTVGHRIPACSTDAFYRRVTGELPDELEPALRPVLEVIARLTQDIRAYDRALAALCKTDYPETRSLKQVAGVGPLVALAYVVTLEDPTRFVKARDVGPYLGLCPKRRQSSGDDPQLRISKAGDPYLRKLLVGSANYILGPFGPDTDLRRWGLALAERGGKNAKKRAIVAVARRLSVLLYRLWVTGEDYEPLRQARLRRPPSAHVRAA